MRRTIAFIFLFTVIAIAVGAGLVMARSGEGENKTDSTPAPVALPPHPVKTIVTVINSGTPISQTVVKSAPATTSNTASSQGYVVPEPKQYVAISRASAAPVGYANIPNAAIAGYSSAPIVQQPVAVTTSNQISLQNSVKTTLLPTKKPPQPSVTPTQTRKVEKAVITSSSNGSYASASASQSSSHPGLTHGSINLSVGVTP